MRKRIREVIRNEMNGKIMGIVHRKEPLSIERRESS